MDDTIIPESILKQRYSVAAFTIYRWSKKPDFPKVAAVINGRRFYKLRDIEEWEKRDV